MNRFTFLCVVSLALVGCADDTTEPPSNPDASGEPTWTSIYNTILNQDQTCTSSGCHGNPMLPPAMGTAGDAYNSLVGVEAGGSCSGSGVYVVPGDPDASVLLQVLDAPNCANNLQMPIGGQPLGADQRAAIRAWITAGAQNN